MCRGPRAGASTRASLRGAGKQRSAGFNPSEPAAPDSWRAPAAERRNAQTQSRVEISPVGAILTRQAWQQPAPSTQCACQPCCQRRQPAPRCGLWRRLSVAALHGASVAALLRGRPCQACTSCTQRSLGIRKASGTQRCADNARSERGCGRVETIALPRGSDGGPSASSTSLGWAAAAERRTRGGRIAVAFERKKWREVSTRVTPTGQTDAQTRFYWPSELGPPRTMQTCDCMLTWWPPEYIQLYL